MRSRALFRLPLAYARGSETSILSRDREEAVNSDVGRHTSTRDPLSRIRPAYLAGMALLLASTAGAADAPKVTFLRDVAPILNKVGCTSGPCHGAAKGKNGFKLSLRGYDPQFDYEALLYDLSGRRFNRADPARSLMLAKPTQQVPHGGGLRFDIGSPYYQTIFNWISQGVPFGDPAADSVKHIDVDPHEIFMKAPEESVTLKVTANYADGGTRDVTGLATVESNTPDVATVSDATIKGARVGEATVMVRYQGNFTVMPVTVVNPKPGFAWKQLPQSNYIDKTIDAKLQRLKIQPSPPADDAAFLRRVSLDLTGQLPTPEEIRAFVADTSKTKRSARIEKLIASPAYVDHWTLKWGDLLQNSRKYLGEKGAFEFREWIREAIAQNKPYDRMVREMLMARGSSYDSPEANFYRVTRDPKPTMEKTTQVFLGVRMVCAQCHDHPFERWTQTQYYEMASFFSAVGIRPGYEVGEEIIFDQRQDFDMKYPKDGRVMNPKFILPANLKGGASQAPPTDATRRLAYAEWLTAKDNPFFAKSTVNRIWSYFLGRGIIDPVDDIRASNPPVNPALLDALTKDFIDRDFDLRQLMRTIANSRTYQASIATNEWNEKDGDNFSHAIPRRLSAEELMDAVALATGVRPVFPEAPPDTRAEQLTDPHIGKGGFLDLFGRPSRESSCECERRSDLSLPQALNLVNGKTISDAVADGNGRIAKAVLAGRSDRDLLDELYLASLSRPPTAAELNKGLEYLKTGSGRAARAQDLLWALLNSKGFLYNW